MEKLIRFFSDNAKMNYILFILVCFVGITSYMKTPKEVFPSFELDKIIISGSYSGASIDILDKMAVREIEDKLQGLQGVDDMTSTISPGSFRITLELIKGTNKYDTAAKIKDYIDEVKQNFPSDMNDPKVTVPSINKSLVDISISSKEKNLSGLIDFAKDLKTAILKVKDISEVTIYGDSDMYYNILVDERKIESLGLNKNSVFNAISGISYIFPVGKIEGNGKHYYLSTYNGKKSSDKMQNTLLKIDGKSIYLSDIAKVEKRYEDSSTLSSIDTKPSLTLTVFQSSDGNALNAKKNIEKTLNKIKKQNPDIDFLVHNDNTQRIKDRLNVVGSNIIFGFGLVTLLLILLINTRMAFIVAIGIPTSFIMAAFYFYQLGYTINLISLVGVLVALGIVVDDAIVIAENIQQKLEEGLPPKEAAIQGAKEVAKPVIFASLTTLFTFIPLLMLRGTMGEFIKLIPIAVSALIVASLIESFIFLPIHAAHTLKTKSKVLSWDRANKIYSSIIHLHVKYKKIFLFLFLVIIPILTFLGIKHSKFQMFPRFDTTKINISIKADINTPIEKSFEIVNEISKDFVKLKDKYGIESVSSVAGYRSNTEGASENYPYVMYITLELYKLKNENFFNEYITPYLSFYDDNTPKIREKTSFEISRELRKFLKQKNYKSKYKLQEIEVAERRAGPVKSDIKIGVVSNDNKKVFESIKEIRTALKKVDGVKSISDSASRGIDEIKIKVNKYGESLGLDEQDIGAILSNLFLSKKKTTAFDDKNLLEIKVQSVNKDDISTLKTAKIPLSDGKSVMLKDVVEFEIVKSFEKVYKDFGVKTFYVYANVDTKKVTASEAIDKIKDTLEKIKNNDVEIKLLGEKKKNDELKEDMLNAAFISLLLIMLSLMYMFNSFRDTFIIMSVIPFSFLGVLIGHFIMGINLTMPSVIGALGLAGVVINDGIVMMTYLQGARTLDQLFKEATKRLRPIFLTSITTLVGLSTLIFFPTGEAAIFQPLAISLGFGLAWGTILNLIYVPTFFAVLHKNRYEIQK
ncbi:efflux RND transporter permease subunit [Sulfurospirillum sp. 1307]